MTYLDSNVFLYALLYDDARAAICRKILESVHNGGLRACTSVLTWDEVTYATRRALGHDAAFEHGEKFLRFPHLKFLDCTPAIVFEANSLCRTAGLKPRDGIHVASAMLSGSTVFVSEDSDFRRAPGLKCQKPAEVK